MTCFGGFRGCKTEESTEASRWIRPKRAEITGLCGFAGTGQSTEVSGGVRVREQSEKDYKDLPRGAVGDHAGAALRPSKPGGNAVRVENLRN